jgi:hypothetical protein
MAAWRLTLRPPISCAIPMPKNWTIHEDGADIGRLYDLTATRPRPPRGLKASTNRAALNRVDLTAYPCPS